MATLASAKSRVSLLELSVETASSLRLAPTRFPSTSRNQAACVFSRERDTALTARRRSFREDTPQMRIALLELLDILYSILSVFKASSGKSGEQESHPQSGVDTLGATVRQPVRLHIGHSGPIARQVCRQSDEAVR